MIDLKMLIKEHPDCLSNSIKFKSYLTDLYPNELGRIYILTSLFEYGAVDFFSVDSNRDKRIVDPYINKFVNDYGFDRVVAGECTELLIDSLSDNYYENIDKICDILDSLMNNDVANLLYEDEQSLREVFWMCLAYHTAMIAKCEGKLSDEEIKVVGCYIGDGDLPIADIRNIIDGLQETSSSADISVPRIVEIVRNIDDIELHKRIERAYEETYNLLLQYHGKEEVSALLYEFGVAQIIRKEFCL